MSFRLTDDQWHPDTRALRYFIAVAEEKSFTRAAAGLRIAQPAVSRQIVALEQQLGTPLFVRLARGVELTEAGTILLRHCYVIFSTFGQCYRDISAHSSLPKGTVVVGMPSTPGELVIPPLVERIGQLYPDIELRFIEGFSRSLERALLAGDVAIAVMRDPPERSDILRRDLLVENLTVISAPGRLTQPHYPLAEVATMPLIMPSRPNYLRIVFDRACRAQGLEPNIIQRVDGMWHLKALVKAGFGHSVMTYGGVLTEIRAGLLEARSIVEPQISWDLCLATRAEQRPKRAVAIVEDAIHDIIMTFVRDGIWATLHDPAAASLR
ncbi:LysR family transcriptional regulator [Paracoccus sp. SM22M-07]|uniref:LysR family transcriptional regulator n=1 Tax=Paracoccus sp. SM22M-07 TaxID=1520813 RepID=UPI00092257E0|nr:LysR family transcriptional regulator [Paracoccus sp. SM22M-07]OJH43327.1 hypothetical protein IE00_17305 [Paracoccus sp. SM22M-07]